MSSPTTLILIRHGAVHNPQQVYYGRLPAFRLSAEGQRQAEAAARVLWELPVTCIYSSPLLRARQTAACLAQGGAGIRPIHLTRLLHEVHTPYDGYPQTELNRQNWNLYAHKLPGYEQPEAVLARARRFVRRILSRHAGQMVAAVSHGDVIAFTLLWARRAPLSVPDRQQLRRLGFPDDYPATASLAFLRFESGGDLTARLPSHMAYIKPY